MKRSVQQTVDAAGLVVGAALACLTIAFIGYWLVKGVSKIRLFPPALTNEEIIRETKKCKDAGMEANQTFLATDFRVTRVTCYEKAK